MKSKHLTGDQLLAALAALSNPHRLRVVAALAAGGRNYVSQLELSDVGKALNFFDVAPFAIDLSPAMISTAVATLTNNPEK